MHDVGLKVLAQATHPRSRVARPEQVAGLTPGGHGVQSAVVLDQGFDLVAMVAQQPDLVIDDAVLTTALLVAVVHDEDLHRGASRAARMPSAKRSTIASRLSCAAVCNAAARRRCRRGPSFIKVVTA